MTRFFEKLAIVDTPKILVLLVPFLYDRKQARSWVLRATMRLVRLW
jgi:hypothetical protein